MPNDFTPSSEELPRLAEAINLLRRDLQDGIATLNRMEKRLRAAFPTYPPKKAKRDVSSSGARSPTTKTEDQLQADFDSLLSATTERGDSGFEEVISTLPEGDVIALAHELGIGSKKGKSFQKARDGIRKRVQESMLLAYKPRGVFPNKAPNTTPS